MDQPLTPAVTENNDYMYCESTNGYNNIDPHVNVHVYDENSDVLRSMYRPHGTLARTLYYKYLADERLQRYDKKKWYAVDRSKLPEPVLSRFLQLSPDHETEQFLEEAVHKSDWVFTQLWHSVARSFLGFFMTQTSINGLLGRGSMFVFSGEGCRLLLGVAADWCGATLLDLGAGDGRTTAVMAPYFAEVFVTEVSAPMRSILAKRGFRLLEADTWTTSGHKFDVISCLNLLDRCDRPLSLLQDLRAALKPGGKVLVALVLPFNPYVEIGWEGHRPSEWLPIQGDNFEQQVTSVMADVFEPAGFAVERWARVPYLCEGDLNQAFYWLDDAVFVLSAGDQEGNS